MAQLKSGSTVGGSNILLDVSNSVDASNIAANAVGSSEIAADAVGSSEIAANAVGASELNTSVDMSWTGSQRATLVTDNDGTFNLNAGQNFTCTPTGSFTLTFTNIPNGQSGTIVLVNTGGHTVSAAATTKVMGADMLTTISIAGTYIIGYISDGTNVRVYNSGIQQ